MATLAARIERPAPVADQEQGLALTYHRLMLVMLLFVGVTFVIVARLAMLQVFTDRSGAAQLANPLLPPRGDIVDRNGVPLARTIDAWSIAVHPQQLIGDRRELAAAARRADARAQRRRISRDADSRRTNFIYLSRRALPELVAAVNALGEPAIVFAREPERLYPQTAMAGHVLGWTDCEGHGVSRHGAGARRSGCSTRPSAATPVALSIDSRVQAVLETSSPARSPR